MKKYIALLGCLVFFLIGCGGGERASISAYIVCYWDWSNPDSLIKEGGIEGYKYNGFKIIPVVMINNDTLPVDYYWYSPTEFYYYGEIAGIDIGDECKLKVDYGEGKGEATDTMPGNFRITNPDSTFVLHKGNNLSISWNSAAGATWYWLTVELWYYFRDNNGNYDDFELYLDTIIDGNSLVINASRIFPSYVDTVFYGSGDISAEAVCGPKLEPGAKGNIKGDAVGFFWCVYDAKPVWFGIEHLAQRPVKDPQVMIRNKHLTTMRKFAFENE